MKVVMTTFKTAILSLLLACGPEAAPQQEKLVPANNFNPRMDSKGYRWDIYQNGYVNQGTNYVYSNALTLQVGGNGFSPRQRMMTADGSEFVLSTQINNLNVTRRIKVFTKEAFARFTEIFQNSGTSPITQTISLQIGFNGNFQSMLTNRGTAFMGGPFGKKDSGFVVIPRQGTNHPASFFLVAAASSKFKPMLQNQNSYRLTISFPITVKPGKTVSIVHWLAQRHMAQIALDAKSLAKVFKPMMSRKMTRDLPSHIRKSIINMGRGGMGSADNLLSLESLNVIRGSSDVLAFGEETRLRGKSSCSELAIKTPYGTSKIAFEEVAAIVGRHMGNKGLLFLRDGQILHGELAAKNFRFTMNSGVSLELKVSTLDRLVNKVSPRDGKPDGEVKAYLETYNGARLALVGDLSSKVQLVTPWGPLNAKLSEVKALKSLEENQPGHIVSLKDGTRCFGYWDNHDLEIETRNFGKLSLNPAQIRSITFAQFKADKEDEDINQPNVVLTGENVLLGQIDLPALHFTIFGQSIPVIPSQIRKLENQGNDDEMQPPEFTAEIWGGGTLAGKLKEGVLPIRSNDRLLHVPVRDIASVHVPSPTISDALRSKVVELIRDLGHPEWEKRELASKGLLEIGYVARGQLKEASFQSPDAEIRRRAKAVLDELD